MVERIQRALTHDQLELHCQPILDLRNNESSQYELLLRLRTHDGHLLPPSAFLDVAERFGTILAIDAWVVRQAVALIATQAEAGRSLTLNLNISTKSIGNPQGDFIRGFGANATDQLVVEAPQRQPRNAGDPGTHRVVSGLF